MCLYVVACCLSVTSDDQATSVIHRTLGVLNTDTMEHLHSIDEDPDEKNLLLTIESI